VACTACMHLLVHFGSVGMHAFGNASVSVGVHAFVSAFVSVGVHAFVSAFVDERVHAFVSASVSVSVGVCVGVSPLSHALICENCGTCNPMYFACGWVVG